MLAYPVKSRPNYSLNFTVVYHYLNFKRTSHVNKSREINDEMFSHRLSPGGARRDRTADPGVANAVLYRLSYGPIAILPNQAN